uniref:Putative DNA polymerase n=1 Tax=viral metagenome TaxID=1070528 RepID=A0A6M3JZD2_9ZZZZ
MTIIKPNKRLVYGEGIIASAKLCFIGEAPGSEEARVGRPFVGPSGSLMVKVMGNVGIARSDCYITNVVKEQPIGNDISGFITFRAGQAYPTQEYKEYEADLYEELKGFQGNIIVAVGGVALWALCRKVGIQKWRGSILNDYAGRKVIPILHPASAMRQHLFIHHIAHDLKRVAEEMEFPDIRLPSRILHVEPSYNEVISYIMRAMECARVGFDIEVMGNEVSCLSVAVSASESMSIPFIKGGRDYFSVEQEVAVWMHLAGLLQNIAVTKVIQNGVFDFTFIFRKYGILIQPILDTMIAQGICYPDMPKGLDFITSVYTREPYYKDEGKRWFKMYGSERDFWSYNAKDSVVCLEAEPHLEEEAEKMGNTECVHEQTALIGPLVYMHTRGMRIDKVGLNKASEEAGTQIEELTKELRAMVGYDINPNSPTQVKKLFYEQKGEKAYISRKTGKETTDINAMKRLVRKGHKEAGIILKIRHFTTLKGTFLDVVLDTDGRLRCAFNPVGTEYGRLSSSEDIFGVGTNTQNLPEEFKKYIIADEDTVLFNVDLEQAENRVVAYIAPEPAMIEAFEKGMDIHKQTAGLIFGKAIGEVSDEEGSSSIGGGLFSERFWGKKANHGLNYDLGYKTFAFLYEIPESEARFIVERYHTAYPGIRGYHSWVRDRLGKGRTLENLFGRHRLFLDRWGDQLFKSAYSFIPQGTVADKINRQGLLHIWRNKEEFRPVDLLNQVHDSIVFQANIKQWSWERIAECLLSLKRSLEQPLTCRGLTFSIPAAIEMGMNLSKNKKMIGHLRKVDTNADTTTAGLARCLYDVHSQLRASLYV